MNVRVTKHGQLRVTICYGGVTAVRSDGLQWYFRFLRDDREYAIDYMDRLATLELDDEPGDYF